MTILGVLAAGGLLLLLRFRLRLFASRVLPHGLPGFVVVPERLPVAVSGRVLDPSATHGTRTAVPIALMAFAYCSSWRFVASYPANSQVP